MCPADGGLQKADGLPEAQVPGPGRGGQASCYGEKNVLEVNLFDWRP